MPALDQFIVERYLDGAIVEWDLPIQDVHVTKELNAPFALSGVILANDASRLAEGVGLFPYNDCIHWVHDGVLQGGGLIQPLSFDEEGNILVEAKGWSTMLDVPVVTGYVSGDPKVYADRADVFLQKFIYHVNDNILNGQMGFFLGFDKNKFASWPPFESGVDNDGLLFSNTTGGTVTSGTGSLPGGSLGGGTGSTGGSGSLGGGSSGSTGSGGSSGSSGSIGSGSAGSSGSLGSLGGTFNNPPNTQNTKTYNSGAKSSVYILKPWEAANCLEEVYRLADGVPADIVESEEWDGDTNNIKKTLTFYGMRFGQPRTNLRFVEGENIVGAFASSTSAEDYANAVLVIGAGQEEKTLIAYKYMNIENVARRVHVIDDDSIYNLEIANEIALFELAQRSQSIHVSQINIDIQHPNCRLNDVRVGDDIKVTAKLPFLGVQTIWHRIVAMDYEPGSQVASLSLSRSDAFNYVFGAPDEPAT